jgi:type II secretion system protein G
VSTPRRQIYLQIVSLLIILLAVDLGWRIYRESHAPHAKRGITVDFFAGYQTALGMFKVDCGRFPTTEEGLEALIYRPTNISAKDWRGPYFDSSSVLKDPWGHDFVYRFPGIRNTNEFEIFSCGPDGMSKTGGEDADDFSSWNSSCYRRENPWAW